MGGWGSGQWQSAKNLTSDMWVLDVRRLQRDGLLAAGQWFMWRWYHDGEEIASIQIRVNDDHVILNYRARNPERASQSLDYPVLLDWTACHLGGRRAWFRCPARGCSRRVAVLYGGTIFACRHCHRLAYASQRETPDDRAMRRAGKIRRRLGWKPGIANPGGDKPKGMHWRTFEKLIAQHEVFANASWMGIAARLGVLETRLSKHGLGLDDLAGD